MNHIIQLRCTLKKVHPPIWRVLQVPFGFRLDQLATLIPMTFGWNESILHEFILSSPATCPAPNPRGKSCPGAHHQERCFVPGVVVSEGFSSDLEDEALTTMGEICPRGNVKLTFVHDFRYNWVIGVTAQKILRAEPGITYPLCLAGKYSSLPRISAGPLTFTPIEEILADPAHEDYEKTLAEVGEDYDPESFDLQAVEEAIRKHPWQ